MTKLVVSKYRSIGSQSIGDTGTKNRAGTTDTSIPIGTSSSTAVYVKITFVFHKGGKNSFGPMC